VETWCEQFGAQRRFYESKFMMTFWQTTVDDCERNPRALWRAVDKLLQPPQQQSTTKLSPDDFALFFRSKEPTYEHHQRQRPSRTLSHDSYLLYLLSSQPRCRRLSSEVPTKSCPLDLIPTWLLKRLSTYIVLSICHMCNLSLQSGVFPAQLKQARVIPLLKKTTMAPDTASSYRPISNLPYLWKPTDLVASRLTSHTSDFSFLVIPTCSTICSPSIPLHRNCCSMRPQLSRFLHRLR